MVPEQEEKNKEVYLDMPMGDEALNFVKSYLRPNHIVFEWGVGRTTIEFSRDVKEYYGVEHDFKYYKDTLNQVGKNVRIHYIPSDSNSLNWFPYVSREGNFAEFRNYIQFVHLIGSFDKKFDIVLIDGRARVECAIEILPYLSDEAVVFIHDFDRHFYWEVLEYYYIEGIVDRLVALRKKDKEEFGINEKDRGFLIEKYLLNNLNII